MAKPDGRKSSRKDRAAKRKHSSNSLKGNYTVLRTHYYAGGPKQVITTARALAKPWTQ